MEKNNLPLISIPELARIIDLILKNVVQEYGVSDLRLQNDLYWDVVPDQLYDPTAESVSCELGSLVDDWEFLCSIQKRPDNAIPQMLMHAAPLLQHLSDVVRLPQSPIEGTN